MLLSASSSSSRDSHSPFHRRLLAMSYLGLTVAMVLGMLPGRAHAQASRFVYQLNDYVLPTNGPAGIRFPIAVTAEGRISEFMWGFNASGWRDLHIRYTLPDGTSFEQVAGQPWVDAGAVYGKQALGTWSLRLTENLPGPSETVSTGFTIVTLRDANPNLPVTGTSVRALAGVDPIIVGWMRTNQIEAATLAVMKNGKLVYSRGYGWQDRARTTATLPEAVSRWASNTKMLTAAAIRKLIAMGKLNLSDRAWDVMAVQPPAGMTVSDPRQFQYTVDELLNHRAGLPRDVVLQSGALGSVLGLGRAATLREMVSYMWTVWLDYDPNPDASGEQHYSNWGYQLLGAMIEKVAGISYDAFIRGYITAPLGATSFQVGPRGPGHALQDELWYAGQTFMDPQWDWNGSMNWVEDPYADDLTTRPGAGSLVSSSVDYMRFLKAYFHSGDPKPSSLVGYSWEYTFYGGGPGNMSATRDRIQPDGSSLEWALLVNESDISNTLDGLRANLDNFFAGITAWPTTNLFHTPAYYETGGVVVMEAERFNTASPRSDVGPWQVANAQAGFSGTGYITMASGPSSNTATWSNAADAVYNVNISTTGDYYVWARRYITGGCGNAAYVGVDGKQIGATFDDSTANANTWAWYKYGTKVNFATPGQHTFTIRHKERDYRVDRIVLVKNSGWSPGSGIGPGESTRK
jgi:CubicO group peptidase (beta-lactamase class C family)